MSYHEVKKRVVPIRVPVRSNFSALREVIRHVTTVYGDARTLPSARCPIDSGSLRPDQE